MQGVGVFVLAIWFLNELEKLESYWVDTTAASDQE